MYHADIMVVAISIHNKNIYLEHIYPLFNKFILTLDQVRNFNFSFFITNERNMSNLVVEGFCNDK